MDCWPSPNQISWDSDCHALPLNSPLLKEVRASGQSSAIHDLSGHLSFNRSSMSQWCYMVLYESKWFLMILVIFTYDSMYVYHCLSVILCDSLWLCKKRSSMVLAGSCFTFCWQGAHWLANSSLETSPQVVKTCQNTPSPLLSAAQFQPVHRNDPCLLAQKACNERFTMVHLFSWL